MGSISQRLGPDLVAATVDYLDRADRLANRDSYNGTREERVDDVQTELLRGVVVGLAAVATAIEDLRRHGLPVEDVRR